jgi:hypothetical protein
MLMLVLPIAKDSKGETLYNSSLSARNKGLSACLSVKSAAQRKDGVGKYPFASRDAISPGIDTVCNVPLLHKLQSMG